MLRIESLLSARLFLSPQIVSHDIYFISNLSGYLSLYRMNYGGSVPQPLLPPHIALHNPHLVEGYSFFVFPSINKILVMVDKDGDENYQPMLIPQDGGFPEPAFGNEFKDYRVHCTQCDPERNIVYLNAESRSQPLHSAFQGNLENGSLKKLGESPWGAYIDAYDEQHSHAILLDSYTIGDHVLYLWEEGEPQPKLLFGTPIEKRSSDQKLPLNSISACHFTRNGGLLFITSLFEDTFGLGYLNLNSPDEVKPVSIEGIQHTGNGVLDQLEHLNGNRYLLLYNIDGCSWAYEGVFDEISLSVKLNSAILGSGTLSEGVLESIHYDKNDDCYALSFSTATSPTQIFTIEGKKREKITQHTHEKILGVPETWLSKGEDASFISFDGTRISARLYLPAPELGFQGPRPLIYYVHGGPQSQERPDFAWFSMPLIQFLTLNGFAVFVPNVRGSSGYGIQYMKQVDRDWGGQDRLDHVYAMVEVLPKDQRLDTTRAGVIGRSYGGYMTLMLASRHPELWSAAVDMFGPYDLTTFLERIPETWKPYFSLILGDPHNENERPFLIERSPCTYIHQIACPLLVIQGRNDPRVIERESQDLVESLRKNGKKVEYLVFENEGHDVLKFENRIRCYNEITNFFKKYLHP